jgi:hypothetical protein
MAAFPPHFRIGCSQTGSGTVVPEKPSCLKKSGRNERLTLFLERRLTAIWLLIAQ